MSKVFHNTIADMKSNKKKQVLVLLNYFQAEENSNFACFYIKILFQSA